MAGVVAVVLVFIGWCAVVIFTTWLVWTTVYVLNAREDRRRQEAADGGPGGAHPRT